jgi:16S rRNA (cytosine1402-N4)-methyltransferase
VNQQISTNYLKTFSELFVVIRIIFMSHIPVLLNEIVKGLALKKGDTVVDGTLGGGGHAKAIIEAIMPGGTFIGIDWDNEFLTQTAEELFEEFGEYSSALKFVHGNYADTKDIIQKKHITGVDAMVADVGFSSWHVDEAHRGFSFNDPDVLDMRYDTSEGTPAYEVVNSFAEQRLADIIFRYGQERSSRRIAKAIVQERRKKRILTANHLRSVIVQALPAARGRQKVDPATKTFQALRIYVNKELDNIQYLLESIPKILQPKGRIAIISFHSMEDALVKHHFKHLQQQGKGEVITKKPITPSEEEIEENPRSRSAKLRIFEYQSS